MTAKLAPYAKTVVAILGLVAQAINLWLPDYSDETTAIVGAIIAALTALGVYAKPNA